MKRTTLILATTGLGLIATAVVVVSTSGPQAPADVRSMIVQAGDLETASHAVLAVGGEITHELGVIDAVAAELTSDEVEELRDNVAVSRMVENRKVSTAARRVPRSAKTASGTTSETLTAETPEASTKTTSETLAVPRDTIDPYTHYPTLVSAPRLHRMGVTGRDVTIAVLDSGVDGNENNSARTIAHYDAINDRRLGVNPLEDSDDSGHGTHVKWVAINGAIGDGTDKYNGIAPEARVAVVKAFDGAGQGSYADVIRGIDWIIKNANRHNIRVLNLSFSAPAQSHYWDDPLNLAVMRAWQAGIVVVASAGNSGPDPMTIGVPGNVPYVITVGAVTDSYTPRDRGDDRLTTFSAAGPTIEAFVKPDLLAPGGHISSRMQLDNRIALEHPELHDKARYFSMSGTSQAAAVVSGIVALVLQQDPSLGPDDVKCRLMAAAHPAVNADGTLAYSVFQQGAGLVNAYDAVFNSAVGCANRSMDIAKDLAGTEHYAGHALRNAEGEYYIEGLEESSCLWNESTLWQESVLWNESTLWQESVLWNESLLWNESTLWQESVLWNESILWNESDLTGSSIAINTWVDQE